MTDQVTQEDADEATDFATRYLYPNCQGVRSALAQAFARHRIAAEQRGAKRERERCLREAEDADPLGKDAFGMREYIAQAIRQGEQA